MGRNDFPNAEVYAAQQEIKQRYNAVLTELIRTNHDAGVRTLLSGFRGLITEPSFDPVGKLPVNSTLGLSQKRNKYKCLLHLISRLVQDNWEFNELEDLSDAEEVKFSLTFLESIAEKGLSSFEIKGTKFPGYYLKEK